jgi:hypothetical protein
MIYWSKAFRMSKNTIQFTFSSSTLFEISSHILMRANKVESFVAESRTDTLREDYFHSSMYTFA